MSGEEAAKQSFDDDDDDVLQLDVSGSDFGLGSDDDGGSASFHGVALAENMSADGVEGAAVSGVVLPPPMRSMLFDDLRLSDEEVNEGDDVARVERADAPLLPDMPDMLHVANEDGNVMAAVPEHQREDNNGGDEDDNVMAEHQRDDNNGGDEDDNVMAAAPEHERDDNNGGDEDDNVMAAASEHQRDDNNCGDEGDNDVGLEGGNGDVVAAAMSLAGIQSSPSPSPPPVLPSPPPPRAEPPAARGLAVVVLQRVDDVAPLPPAAAAVAPPALPSPPPPRAEPPAARGLPVVVLQRVDDVVPLPPAAAAVAPPPPPPPPPVQHPEVQQQRAGDWPQLDTEKFVKFVAPLVGIGSVMGQKLTTAKWDDHVGNDLAMESIELSEDYGSAALQSRRRRLAERFKVNPGGLVKLAKLQDDRGPPRLTARKQAQRFIFFFNAPAKRFSQRANPRGVVQVAAEQQQVQQMEVDEHVQEEEEDHQMEIHSIGAATTRKTLAKNASGANDK